MYRDDILEQCIQKIKDSKHGKNKLLNYKKAHKRLNDLQSEYNGLCEILKQSKKSTKAKPVIDGAINTDKIIAELEKILIDIDGQPSADMFNIINIYIQYKLLLDDLNIETDKIKNEIHKVSSVKNKISITKLDPAEIL